MGVFERESRGRNDEVKFYCEESIKEARHRLDRLIYEFDIGWTSLRRLKFRISNF